MYFDISGYYTGSFNKSVEHRIHSLELDGLNHQMFNILSSDLNPGNRTGSYTLERASNTTLYSSKAYQVNLLTGCACDFVLTDPVSSLKFNDLSWISTS